MAQSIDSIYEQALKTLTDAGEVEKISSELYALCGNGERVLYVDKILKKHNLHPKERKISKSAKLSDEYRELGNARFKKSEDYEALQYYNLSLMHAPLNSTQVCLAYSNRSAVLYSLKRYRESSNDINKVFGLNYPEKLKDKLSKRLKQCEEAVPSRSPAEVYKEDLEYFYNKEFESNEQYPCSSKKIEVIHSKEMGRHVIAREDISVGEIIAMETPYANLLLRPQSLFTCGYCFSRSGNLMPCNNCCFVLYCSDECRKNAKKEYHHVECPIMPYLLSMDFTKLELLALRVVIRARCEQPDWDNLFKLIEDVESKLNTEYRGHIEFDSSHVYDSKYYNSIHALATNLEKRTASDIFQKAVTAAVFFNLLSKTDFMDGPNERGKTEKTVAGLLLHHSMTCPTNMHTISSTIGSAMGIYVCDVEIGCGAYAFLSLINHSCAPNVVRFNKLGTDLKTLIALRPIKKGTQLFDNYGYHHALQTRMDRQKSLKSQYKFDCTCEACVEDWPTYTRLRPVLGRSLLDTGTIDKLQNGDIKVALDKYDYITEYAGYLNANAPCLELADAQEAMKQCLFIFYGTVPYGYSRVVDWDPLATAN